MGFSVYDLLKEADGDDQGQGTAPADPATADAPAETDNAGNDNNNENNNDNNDEDNFDIDANLDQDENNDDENGGDEPADVGGDDDLGGGDTGGGDTGNEDEEPVEANTDIFASLSAEEQQMKIMELKAQYNNLYTSCNDLIEKVNNLEIDEDSVSFIHRINNTLFDLKKYIADYLVYTFAQKSFIENDIMFNRFLAILQSITVAFDKYQIRKSKEIEDNMIKNKLPKENV